MGRGRETTNPKIAPRKPTLLAGAESAEVLGSLRDLHFQVDANKIFTGEKPKHLILVKTRW